MTTTVAVGAAAVPVFLTVTGAAFIVALIVQNTKFLLKGLVANKDTETKLIRLYVFLCALIVTFGDRILATGVVPGRLDILDGLSFSVAVTGAAILSYQLLTSDNSPTPPLLASTTTGSAPPVEKQP